MSSTNPAISRVDDRRRGRGNANAQVAAEAFLAEQEVMRQQQERLRAENNAIVPQNGVQSILDEIEDTEELPEYACSYCRYHEDPKCCVKCVDCGKWFCNGNGLLSVSHIVGHLAKAKHKAVRLHEDTDVGSDILECYHCESQNVFGLGIVNTTDGSLVLCREPCLHAPDVIEGEIEIESWTSIIANRQILGYLCGIPSADTMASAACRNITNRDWQLIEDAWAIKADMTVDQALEFSSMQRVVRGQFRFMALPKLFRDGNHMRDLYLPLINDERDKNREMDSKFELPNVTVIFVPQHGRIICQFTTTSGESHEKMMSCGRPIGFVSAKTGIEYESILIKSEAATKVTDTRYTCELSHRVKGAPEDGVYTITLIFNPVTFDRMTEALTEFARDGGRGKSCSRTIYNTFLGKRGGEELLKADLPQSLDAPNIATLNDVQRRAVGDVLLRPFSLIQGPPGTGKTTTTATIVYHLSKMFRDQILVCAPSNIAVDELTQRIAKTGLKVVRVVARSREDVATDVENLCLHYLVEHSMLTNTVKNQTLRELTSKRKDQGTLNSSDYEKYIVLQKKAEDDVLRQADVICCTSAVSADKRLAKIIFKHVVIDESTQSHEAETLIPITKGAEQVILIGDHCQMGPVVLSRDAGEAGLSKTTFERLVSIGHRPHRLEIQYRMHPELSKFSSNMFYEGALQNGVTAQSRDSSKMFPWPDPSKPFFFYHTTNPEEMGSSGMSVLNRREAHLAESMVSLLLKNKVQPEDIGVITPYEAQRNYLNQHLQRAGQHNIEVYKRIEVASVDSFQGREKDFIILSCVRSNDSHAIGFLKDWRRMNVALTRARKGVMVIGNAMILAEDVSWNSFLEHCKSRGLIVNGSVFNLDRCDIDIPPPKRNKRNQGPSEETLALVRGNRDEEDPLKEMRGDE